MGIKKIIAEVGQAHDGSLGMAHSYIDAIHDSEFDAIKFQTHIADAESSEFETFRVPFSYEDATRYDYWRRMEFTLDQWKELKTHCDNLGLEFISSPFSVKAFEYLEELDVKTYKVASGVVENDLLIDKIMETGKNVIISTGMYGETSIDNLFQRHPGQIASTAILHCVTAYPAPIENLNLARIKVLKEKYPESTIGYSDHSGEIWPLIVAASIGAEIFEYHITFDKRSFGPDSKASILIDHAREAAKIIKSIELAIGSKKTKKMPDEELKNLFGYSLTAKHSINQNESIKIEHLETAKPANHGLSPKNYKSILGKKAKMNIQKGDFITKDMIDE